MQRDAGRVHPFIFTADILPSQPHYFTGHGSPAAFSFRFSEERAIIEPLLVSSIGTELTDCHCSSLSSQERKHIAFSLQRNVCGHRDVAALAENAQLNIKVRTAACAARP